ncbi:MAG: inorganic diphosphatase [Candidatus Micrarchaeota archaeon]|nr:inorganic diphosphatase [Candidatus Micrarchaeota archaeon]
MRPQRINAIIEMVSGSKEKYAFDAKTGKITLKRVMNAPLPRPFNYGCLPNLKGGDGVELDVFVISSKPLRVGERIQVRPIGILHMTDEKGIDSKIVSVDLSDRRFNKARSIRQIDQAALQNLRELVEHNKDGEKDKWVNVFGFADADSAIKSIVGAMSK